MATQDVTTLPTTRIEAFSDGVFSIIVTLLVLELTVPEVTGPHINAQLSNLIWHLIPKLSCYVISFLSVSVFWIAHYQFFHTIKHSTRGLLWINTTLLMLLAFVPFPTALLGEYPNQPAAVMLYGIVLFLCGMTVVGMRLYTRAAGLHKDIDPAILTRNLKRRRRGIICSMSLGNLGVFIGV